MRRLTLLAVFSLSACGTTVPIEELERQAFLTGDWSAVEARERMELRRNLRPRIQCPSGSMGYCEVYLGSERCSCIDRKSVSLVLSSR